MRLSAGVGESSRCNRTLGGLRGPHPVHRHGRLVVDPHHVFATEVAAGFGHEAPRRSGALVWPYVLDPAFADAGHRMVPPRQAEQHRAVAQQTAAGVEEPQVRPRLVDDDKGPASVVAGAHRPVAQASHLLGHRLHAWPGFGRGGRGCTSARDLCGTQRQPARRQQARQQAVPGPDGAEHRIHEAAAAMTRCTRCSLRTAGTDSTKG
jgi:hypothetical protein